MPLCIICDGEHEAEKGVTCGKADTPHFTCSECLNEYAPTCLEPVRLRELRGNVPCPGRIDDIHTAAGAPCTAPPWNFKDLQSLFLTDTTAAFITALQTFLSTLMDAEEAKREREKAIADRNVALAAAAEFADRANRIAELRTQLINEYFTLRCPRCHQAFVDYDGCDALTCERCGCGFCGLCLKDCGKDAHAHVAEQNHAKMANDSRVYASVDAKRHIHADLRKKALAKAISGLTVTDDIKRDVINAMQKDLLDIAINADDVIKEANIPRAALRGGRGGGGGGDAAAAAAAAAAAGRDGAGRRNERINNYHPPPASRSAGIFGNNDIRYAASDCLEGDACTKGLACRFRHEPGIYPAYCSDWVVSRDSGSSYCERGPACPYAHPYYKAIVLTDCPSCPPGAKARGTPCAYTGGLPSMLRHANSLTPLPQRPVCRDFSPPPKSRICPRASACPHAHLM
jgi:hypothetical protein